MMDTEQITAGMDQMDFAIIDNGVLELPSSTPATYTFTSEPTYNPDGFTEAIENKDFGVIDVNTEQKDSGEFYYYADVITDHAKKLHVKVWQNRANVYPKEERIDTYEFSRVVHAIEDAFDSELEHTND